MALAESVELARARQTAVPLITLRIRLRRPVRRAVLRSAGVDRREAVNGEDCDRTQRHPSTELVERGGSPHGVLEDEGHNSKLSVNGGRHGNTECP